MEKDKIDILVIDDEELTREILKRILKALMPKMLIKTTDDGQRAINLARAYLPSTVVTDMQMPNSMSGTEIISKLKQIGRCNVIAMSGGGEEMEKAAMEAGADYFLYKPFSLQKIEKIFSQMKMI